MQPWAKQVGSAPRGRGVDARDSGVGLRHLLSQLLVRVAVDVHDPDVGVLATGVAPPGGLVRPLPPMVQ
eukprot:gene7140-biopygen4983